MTINYVSKYANSDGNTATSNHSTGNQSYTSGRRIIVFAQALRNGHSNGFGTNWACTDDATTNSITWNRQATHQDSVQGANFECESVVFYSSELTANETFDITVDPDSGSSSDTYFNLVNVVEVENWDGTFGQVVSNNAASATQTGTFTFSPAPSSGDQQLSATLIENDGTVTTWVTPATNWSVIASSEYDGPLANRLLSSTTNTAASPSDGTSTGGGTYYNLHRWGLILNETAAGPNEGTSTLSADADITSVGARDSAGTSDLDAEADITSAGARNSQGAATLSANASITAVGSAPGVAPASGTATFSADASIASAGARGSAGGSTLGADASISAVGSAGAAIIKLDIATEGNQGLEVTNNVIKLDMAMESNLASELAVDTIEAVPDVKEIDDWVTAPPDYGQWGTKLNEWQQDLVEIIRSITDNDQRDGTLLWSRAYTIRVENGSSTALDPLPLVFGNASDAPRFDFPTTMIIEVAGQHGLNATANTSVLWGVYDQYNGPGSNADEGNQINFPWSSNYSDLGAATLRSPFSLRAGKQLEPGEQPQWAAGYAISAGSHNSDSQWHVKIYRGHILQGAGSESGPLPINPLAFDDGRPGEYGDYAIRATWFHLFNRTYFEPQHNPAGTGPVRVVYATASGTGNGLTPGTPTSLSRYMSSTGITPAAGDQVRVVGVGPHNLATNVERSIKGTAANPIRWVRDDPAVEPIVQNSQSGNSTWPFTDSEYLGFHGLDIDGNYSTYNNIWGLSFGTRFSGDTGQVRCRYIDIWHCKLHDQAQNCLTFEGTEGSSSGDFKSHNCHLFASEVYNSGQDSARSFSELTYWGNGSNTAENAYNICIEACDLHDGPSGEAIDLKQENRTTAILGCKIHNVRVTSQGAIAAFFTADLFYHYNQMWDIDQKSVGGNDGCGIWASSIDADYNLMWTVGLPAVVSSRLNRGTMGVVFKHFTGWNLETQGGLGQGTLHFQNTGLFDEGVGQEPALNFENATCISDDGDQGSYNAAVADFVGPLTGDYGSPPGFNLKLASTSSIPATAGPIGKE